VLGLNRVGCRLEWAAGGGARQGGAGLWFLGGHIVDVLGAVALMCGLGWSGLLHQATAMAMLIAFLVLSSESYLATYTLKRFELSQGNFGPTEIRILLAMGCVAALRSPYATVFGHKMLLFDLGGAIATLGMAGMAVAVTVRHTAQLYRHEPIGHEPIGRSR